MLSFCHGHITSLCNVNLSRSNLKLKPRTHFDNSLVIDSAKIYFSLYM